jgi:hypothetical protein
VCCQIAGDAKLISLHEHVVRAMVVTLRYVAFSSLPFCARQSAYGPTTWRGGAIRSYAGNACVEYLPRMLRGLIRVALAAAGTPEVLFRYVLEIGKVKPCAETVGRASPTPQPPTFLVATPKLN